MMHGGRRTSGRWTAAGILLVACLVAARGLQAAALRACPHHGGAEGHEIAAPPGAHDASPAAEHEASAPPPGHHAPGDDDPWHEGPCDCLGPCSAHAAVDIPRTTAESPFAQVAPRSLVRLEARVEPPTLRTIPFALPYPNAPPA